MKHRLTDDRGQATVIVVLGLWVFVTFAALSIDLGLMITDRRDAQSDVDKVALAGALELTLDPATAVVDEASATLAAQQWAAQNGIDTTQSGVVLNVDVVNTCYSANDPVPTGVRVSLQRQPQTFLIGLLGVTNWDSHATAVACAGRPAEAIGFLPFALSESSSCFEDDGLGGRRPRLGEFCDLVIDSNSQGLSGELGIATGGACEDGNSSASVLHDNIVDGTQTYCAVGDSVQGNPGHNVGQTKDGIQQRVGSDGACDANFSGTAANFAAGNLALSAVSLTPLHAPSLADGLDDFYETWSYDATAVHPAASLEPYDCDPATPGVQSSPRNVLLIVVSDFASPDGSAGPKSYLVRGFARVYLEGCSDANDVFHKDCQWSGGGKFTIHARFVEQYGLTSAGLGYQSAYGDVEVFIKQ